MKITPLRIRCAVCDKPVDDVLFNEDQVNFCYRIIVRCHGSRDEMSFTSSDIIRHGQEGWEALIGSEGLAFRAEALGDKTGDRWRDWAERLRRAAAHDQRRDREAWRYGPYGE